MKFPCTSTSFIIATHSLRLHWQQLQPSLFYTKAIKELLMTSISVSFILIFKVSRYLSSQIVIDILGYCSWFGNLKTAWQLWTLVPKSYLLCHTISKYQYRKHKSSFKMKASDLEIICANNRMNQMKVG